MTMDKWVKEICEELGLDAKDVDVEEILAMTKVVAYAVERTAAPVTSLIMGLAIAKGQDGKEVSQRIQDFASNWQKD